MNTQSIKLSLVDWLLQADEKTLLKVDRIRKSTKIQEHGFLPMSIEELENRALESERAIQNGDVISLEDLQEEIKGW